MLYGLLYVFVKLKVTSCLICNALVLELLGLRKIKLKFLVRLYNILSFENLAIVYYLKLDYTSNHSVMIILFIRNHTAILYTFFLLICLWAVINTQTFLNLFKLMRNQVNVQTCYCLLCCMCMLFQCCLVILFNLRWVLIQQAI